MKSIITIQHTQSVHHLNGMIGSHTDWDLTAEGKQQAENIGKSLAAFVGDKRYVMYSSDLARARQTAERVAAHLGIQPVLEPVLRERDLGEAVGKSEEWAHQNTIVWEKTVDDRPFNGAQTVREQWHSLAPFVDEIINSRDENIIVVSHGGTLSVLHAIWVGLQPQDLNRCGFYGASGGVSILNLTPEGKRVIRRLSDMSFKM